MIFFNSASLDLLMKIVCCTLCLLSPCNCAWDPLGSRDILQTVHLSNHYQCQRLCWYRKPCVRYSFNNKNDGSDVNCILHLSSGTGVEMSEGWISGEASGGNFSPNQGCVSRTCPDMELCLPVKGQLQFICHYVPIADGDECNANPCQNGGTCTDGVASYSCVCMAGFSGHDCQIDIDECTSNPCQNNGNCTDHVNSYFCECPAAYTGDHCQTDGDECNANPCQNGGTCTDGVASYSCVCMAGFSGHDCQIDIDECTSNPCQNNGNCTDHVNSYFCECPAAYTGDHCQTELDECTSNPCQHNGNCTDQINGYTCSCASGYSGDQCETDVNECASGPCQYGGTCTDQVNGYYCSCRPQFRGIHCQTEIWLNKTCEGNDTCAETIPESGCFSGSCLCANGYFYSVSQNDCISNCTDLQNNYLQYLSYDFFGHDATSLESVEPAACQNVCSGDVQCRLFTYITISNRCYLKYLTPVDYPDNWKAGAGVNTYQKTCA